MFYLVLSSVIRRRYCSPYRSRCFPAVVVTEWYRCTDICAQRWRSQLHQQRQQQKASLASTRSFIPMSASEKHFQDLENKSMDVLERMVENPTLLQQWYNILPSLSPRALQKAVLYMDTLWWHSQQHHWPGHFLEDSEVEHPQNGELDTEENVHQQENKNNRLDEERCVRETRGRLLLKVKSHFQPDGPQALQVLRQMYQEAGEQDKKSSLRDDYHYVLLAYASEQKDSAVQLEGAFVALELLEQLQHQQFQWKPNILTYALATVCLTNAVATRAYVDNSSYLQRQWRRITLHGFYQELGCSIEGIGARTKGDPLLTQWLFRAVSGILEHSKSFGVHEECRHLVSIWISLVPHVLSTVSSDMTMVEQLRQDVFRIVDSGAISLIKSWCTSEIINSDPDRPLTTVLTILDDILQSIDIHGVTQLPRTEHFYWATKTLKQCHKQMNKMETKEAYQLVQKWLAKMQAKHESCVQSVSNRTTIESSKLVSSSWNHMMMAYFELDLYKEVIQVWNIISGNTAIWKNRTTFRIVLQALAELGTYQDTAKAHALWKQLATQNALYPNVQLTWIDCETVMTAWSKTCDPTAYNYCQEIMNHLQNDPKGTHHISSRHYSALIVCQAWSNNPYIQSNAILTLKEMKDNGAVMDFSTYKIILEALTLIKSKDAAQTSHALLQEMEDLQSRNKLRLDQSCYLAVMKTWSGSGCPTAYVQCEQILNQWRNSYIRSGQNSRLKLTPEAYAVLIEAHKKREGIQNHEQYDSIVKRMIRDAVAQMSEPPDSEVYTALLQALSTIQDHGRPEVMQKMENIFEYLVESYRQGNTLLKPGPRALTIVLEALSRSSRGDKVGQCRQLLDDLSSSARLGFLGIQPNAEMFELVLYAASSTHSQDNESRSKIIDIAMKTFHEMDRQCGSVTETAYYHLFHVILGHANDQEERQQKAEDIFNRCCRDGLISARIVRTIRLNFQELYLKFPRDSLGNVNLPEEWSR